jgi:ferrous iron transport protein B
MSTIYGVAEDEPGRSAALRERLRAARDEHGRPAYTPLVALGLMAFYVFALMCTSTVAVTVRECGGGRAGVAWAALQFTYMLALAYAFALVVYRVGMAAAWSQLS